MDVRLPNGTIIQGVPSGTSKQEVQDLAIRNNLATLEDFGVKEEPSMYDRVAATNPILPSSDTIEAGLAGIKDVGANFLTNTRELGESLFGKDSFMNQPIFGDDTTETLEKELKADVSDFDKNATTSQMIAKEATELAPFLLGGMSLPAMAGRSAYAGITADKNEDPLINVTGDSRIDSMLTNMALEGIVGGAGKVADVVGKEFIRSPYNKVAQAKKGIDAIGDYEQRLPEGFYTSGRKEIGDAYAIKATDDLAKRGGVINPKNLDIETSGVNVAEELGMSKRAVVGKALDQFNESYGIPIAGKLTKYGEAGAEAKNAKIFNDMESELINKARNAGATPEDLTKIQETVKDYALYGKTDLVDEELLKKYGLLSDTFTLKKVRQVGGISPEMIENVSKSKLDRISDALTNEPLGNSVSAVAGIATGGTTTIGQSAIEAISQLTRRSLSKDTISKLRGDPSLVQSIRDGIATARNNGIDIPVRGAIKQIESMNTGESGDTHDVTLPNGMVIKGVPKNMSESDLLSKLKANGYLVDEVKKQPTQVKLNTSNPKKFVNSSRQGAIEASKQFEQEFGIPIDPTILQAQSSLETGWGKKIIKGSNNMFNIKADKEWLKDHPGQFVEVMTREERPDGSSYYVKDKFRKYDSTKDSYTDYINFLAENPRYKTAIANADDPERFFSELQKAGYATDTRYSKKLMNQMNSVNRRLA